MVDNHTSEQRTANMKAIRYKDTKIEMVLRKELWSRGIRYRKNCKDVSGKPDIVFKGKKVAVFCDSEFWHGYDWGNQKDRIGTRRDYWFPKIERNMERDREVNNLLRSNGWTVIRFWGKQISKDTKGCADEIQKTLEKRNDEK